MLNWADFSVLLMILAGPFSGVAAAHQHKAGVLSLILFGCVGLAVGFGIGQASSKLAYRVLGSKTLPAGLQFVSYMLIPMISLLLVILVPALLAMMIYGQT
jgi:hypothetical protein